MAPKKKVKSIQRGFATTSTIKKKEEVQDTTPDVAASNNLSSPSLIPNAETSHSDSSQTISIIALPNKTADSGNAWDASEEERQREDNQALSDRIKAAADKEASKTFKIIDYEKRVAATYPEFTWDDPTDICGRAIDLAIKEDNQAPLVGVADTYVKLLIRIANIHIVLEKLGFTTAQIQECLTRVPALELEDATNWLYLRYRPNASAELEAEDSLKPYGLGHWDEVKLSLPDPIRPKPAATPIESLLPDSGLKASAKGTTSDLMDPKSDGIGAQTIDTPSTPRLLAYQNNEGDSSDDENGRSSQNLLHSDETIGNQSTDQQATNGLISEDDIAEDPDSAYVKVKLRLTTLQRRLGLIAGKSAKKGNKLKAGIPLPARSRTAEDDEVDKLEVQMKQIRAMYTFNPKRAEAAYAEERSKLDKAELASRLAEKAKQRMALAASLSDQPLETPQKDSSIQAETPSHNGTTSTGESNGIDTLFGDMLEDDSANTGQEDASPLLSSSGSVIIIRSMPLPKGYTGKTPRSLLDDAIRRLDKYAKATYRVLARGRAVRAVVTLRWEASGKVEQYGMEEEACDNQDQAFQYVATLALFAVSGDSGVHRMLPAVFRDLWDELSKRRIDADIASYEKRLQMFREIADARPAVNSSTDQLPTTRHSAPPPFEARPNGVKPTEFAADAADKIMLQLQDRQASPAYQSMLPVRQSLPIASYRNVIVETVEKNQVVVLCGETGCGKSTQTPTMILESALAQGKPAKIYCTEPRRISAISLAQRVSQELGENPGALGGPNSYVGYNIRLESRVSASTRLIYVTTGILLRMLENDTELADVTHVIIDEVHERSIDSDFLLIILRQLLKRRRDLRVMLMSATVDAEKISEYMGSCPVITVPGRTFPVTDYYLEDAVELSRYQLTAESDSPYVRRYQRKAVTDEDVDRDDVEEPESASTFSTAYSKQTLTTLEALNESMVNFDLIIFLLETICFTNQQLARFSSAILIFLPSLDTIRKLCDLLESHRDFGSGAFQVFPLHSSISNDQQGRVFQLPPKGIRKIVVSTNIAETGVTIPDITAVIDSGRHKEMRYDERRQISRLVECWIARSNALQRRGRAGRVQEGICFHLFTKTRLETGLAEHPIPEMLRLSLQDLALRIKILKFPGSIEHTLLQALDPPLAVNIQRAVNSLVEVKALTTTEDVTQLGRHLVKLPLDVHTAKLCLLATIFGCLDAALTIAAALNNKSFFVTPFGREAEADTLKRSFKVPDEHSDFLVIYRAYRLWRSNCEQGSWSTFCRKHFLSHQNLVLVEELKVQYIGNLIDAGFISSRNGSTRYQRCPRIRFADIEAHLNRNTEDPSVVMACIAAAMHPKLLYLDHGRIWKTLSNNAPIAIHPSSSNFIHGRKADFGDARFMTFFNIQQSKKLYVWENGVVAEKAVMLLCGEVDVKHYAHSASIDRKIRRRVDRKIGLAVDQLRLHFDDILAARLKSPDKPLSEQHSKWFQLLEESLTTPKDDEQAKAKKPMSVNIVRPE